jgi:hypothetical protein
MPTERGEGNVPWPIAVSFLIRPLPEEFSLPEVYAIADPLRRAFPNNNHVRAKIRQSLQILRDRGDIAFDGSGRYRKLRLVQERSVHIDFSIAAQFKSRAQVARVAIETWAAANVDCWRCRSALIPMPANAELMDAVCSDQHHEVQVKAISGVAKDRLSGAAYGPMLRRLSENGRLPDYLIVSYDRPRSLVLLAEFVDGSSLGIERITARAPLTAGAKRAGWIGATIDLDGLARHTVVGPSFEPEIEAWP